MSFGDEIERHIRRGGDRYRYRRRRERKGRILLALDGLV